jgi:hypothetical protein
MRERVALIHFYGVTVLWFSWIDQALYLMAQMTTTGHRNSTYNTDD